MRTVNHVHLYTLAFFSAVAGCLFSLPLQAADPPGILNHQGRISVGFENFNGGGQFKFALVDGEGTVTTLWSNDDSSTGGGEPTLAVTVAVEKGHYQVPLGDTAFDPSNMTETIPASVFADNSDVRLRIWFSADGGSTFEQLSPDQRITSVGYSLSAASVMGGSVSLGGGNLALPTTTASAGQVMIGGKVVIHSFGTDNTFTGADAGNQTMTGFKNVANGSGALSSNTTGSQNVAVGNEAMTHNTTGQGNVAVGEGSLQSNSKGNNNTALGDAALNSNTTGSQNVAVGENALLKNTTAGFNTAVGTAALAENLTGVRNAAVGWLALNGNTTGANNAAFGTEALRDTTTGSSNTASGFQAMRSNTTGSQNTAVGLNALSSMTGGGSVTAVGANAMRHANSTRSTAVGAEALKKDTAGEAVAIGMYAMENNTSGGQNTAVGMRALRANQTGNSNTAVGKGALENSTSSFNTALGASALRNNTGGVWNTGVGITALYENLTGGGNIAVGEAALYSNVNGFSNTAVGYSAGGSVTGSHNITIGTSAGGNLTTGDSNIAIGASGVAAASDTTWIGSGQTRAFVAGIRGVTTGVADAIPVVIDSDGQLGTVSSSRRYKEDIVDMNEASEAIGRLRPVTFRYKEAYNDGEKPIQYGLIAEEVAKVFPELTVFNAEGKPETVKYQLLAPLLLNEVQKLQSENAELLRRLEAVEAHLIGNQ